MFSRAASNVPKRLEKYPGTGLRLYGGLLLVRLGGALQRANLELNIKPVDIFIGNFFSRLTG